MNDLISRQAAIDKAIMIPVARIVTEDKVLWRKAVFVEDIEALPPVDAVPARRGKWVKIIDEETPNLTKWHYECDQCGAGRWEEGQRYCQNCGAKMEGGEEE